MERRMHQTNSPCRGRGRTEKRYMDAVKEDMEMIEATMGTAKKQGEYEGETDAANEPRRQKEGRPKGRFTEAVEEDTGKTVEYAKDEEEDPL